MSRFLTLSVGIFLLAGTAGAKTLYVDANRGDDATSYAANSASSPWRTVGRAAWGSTNRRSPNAAEAAKAGDVVTVAAGTYDTTATTGQRYEPIYNPANNGTASSPITFKAADGAQVYLRASSVSTGQPIIGAYQKTGIVWDGFLIDERYILTAQDTGPVVVWNSSAVTLQNLTINGYSRGWADNHNGIRLESTDNVTVRNNTISGYKESAAGMNASAITLYRSKTTVIENNTITNASTGIFVKGLVEGPTTLRYNLIRDTDVGVIFGGVGTSTVRNGAIAYGNVIVNGWSGFTFIGYDSVSPANVDVVNNTVINACCSDGGAILFRPGYSGYRNIRIANNLLARSGYGITAWENQLSQVRSDYNAFYDNRAIASIGYRDVTLATLRSTHGKDANSLTANPMFTDEQTFKISSSSPLAGAAPDVLDLNRNGSTSDRVNIGAYATGNELIGRQAGAVSQPAPAPPRPNPPDAVVVQ